MLSTSLKASGDVLLLPPKWIPSPLLWSNYRDALTALPFGRYYWNTIQYTFLAVFGETFSSAMVAYALARLRGPGHRFFFVLILSTMMLPWQVTLIPQFVIFRTLGWVDSLKPLSETSGALQITAARAPTSTTARSIAENCAPRTNRHTPRSPTGAIVCPWPAHASIAGAKRSLVMSPLPSCALLAEGR